MKHESIKDGEPVPSRVAKRATMKDAAFDANIGGKIRALRISRKLSQMHLGKEVGISFQQIQKYETGVDRISASMLKSVAAVFGVHPGEFFDDAPTSEGPQELMAMPQLRATMHAGEMLWRIRDAGVRRRAIALIEALAEEDDRSSGLATAAE